MKLGGWYWVGRHDGTQEPFYRYAKEVDGILWIGAMGFGPRGWWWERQEVEPTYDEMFPAETQEEKS